MISEIVVDGICERGLAVANQTCHD